MSPSIILKIFLPGNLWEKSKSSREARSRFAACPADNGHRCIRGATECDETPAIRDHFAVCFQHLHSRIENFGSCPILGPLYAVMHPFSVASAFHQSGTF